MRVSARLTLGLVCLLSGAGWAADWPQFLGPNRNAVSDEKVLETWSAGEPQAMWSVDIGPGYGGAAIRDGKVFILDRIAGEGDHLRVFDLKSGKPVWDYRYEATKGSLPQRGSRSTPTVDADHVYTVGGFGDLYCISRKTHQPVWHVSLPGQYQQGQPKWGYAQSPLLYKDMVIVTTPSEKSPGLVAMNKDTGKVVWTSENFGGDYYVSPLLRKIAGHLGILQLVNKHLEFVDADTGKTLWTWGGYTHCSWPIPAPTVMPDGQRIFITGGYGGGSTMIRVTPNGDGFKVDELFHLKEGSQIHMAVYYDGYLYANINENATLRKSTMKNGGFACIDPNTGKMVWNTGESPNIDRGGFMLAGNRFIILDGQNGEIYLVKPDPKKFDEVSHAKVFDVKRPRGNNIWAPLALSDGLLVIRDQEKLKCLNVAGRSVQ